jgi:V/A-type H+/Na+-transporting ATPase subunit E
MTLERLLGEIELRAQHELDAEERRVAAETLKISEEGRRRIETLRSESEKSARHEASRLKAQRLAAAKLQARRMEYEARERQVAGALEGVRRTLAEYTRSPEYSALLKGLYSHAVDRLGKSVKVSGRAEDASLLKTIAGRNFVSHPVVVLGGLVAETPDGARRLWLTFDELLRLREDRLREILLAA